MLSNNSTDTPDAQATPQLTRLCLVRHGETDWNVVRRVQGSINRPLNANGMEQARLLAAALATTSFDAIYSSDLLRALQTAEQVAALQQRPVITMSALRERHFGVFEGLTRDEALLQYPDLQDRSDRREPDFAPPGGESLQQLYERIARALEEIAGRHAGECILIVVHGGVLDAARRYVTGMPLHAPRDFRLGNAALNWISLKQGNWTLGDWNDQRHLESSRDELRI